MSAPASGETGAIQAAGANGNMTVEAATQVETSGSILPVCMIVLGVLIVAVAVGRQVKPASEGLPKIAAAPGFRFMDQTGGAFESTALVAGEGRAGCVWIADFVFTNCAGPCPIMTLQMAEVQKNLEDLNAGEERRVRFVTFSVDPERDTPEVLRAYARQFNAGPGWTFLTGERAAIHELSARGFFLPVVEMRLAASQPIDATIAEEVVALDPEHGIGHSTKFVLVDHQGRIRGYFDGTEPEECARLERAARALVRDMSVPPSAAGLPAVNATLNASSFLLLAAGFIAIRMRRADVHRMLMMSACVTALLFLMSYVSYHYLLGAGTTSFAGPAGVKTFYIGVLMSHTVLAAAIVPLVIVVLVRAFRGRFTEHRRLARVTLPLWIYVSITGVLIYLLLYQIYPASGVRL